MESEGGDALRRTTCKEYCIPLEYNLYNTNTHTWQHVINIASCSGSHHGSVYQLLSLEQHMCGRYSRGKAPRLTTLLIKTCRPAFVCVGWCSCVLSVCSGMLFSHFCSCVHLVNVHVSGTRGTSESRQRCCLCNWYHLSWMWWRLVEAARGFHSWKYPNAGKKLVVCGRVE